MIDFVTVLQCAEGKRLAKLYHDLDTPPDDYDAGMFFKPATIELSNLEDLACLLLEMSDQPEYCIIRGACHPDAEAEGAGLMRRYKDDSAGEPAFSSAAHHWVALDVDKSDETFLIDEPEACLQRWRQSLPAGLFLDDIVWQWSAKAHLSPTVRGRAWFWVNRPVDDEHARAFCKAYGYDPALCNPIQPHFTARPIFPAGVADPILEPVVFLRASERVPLG